MTPNRIVTIDIETRPADFCDLPVEGSKTRLSPEEAHLRTALAGEFGQLICIGYIDEQGGRVRSRGVLGFDEDTGRFVDDERGMLLDFWELLRGFEPSLDVLVGHNIAGFDLPFLLKRSIVRGVRPTVSIRTPRYRTTPVADTMLVWNAWNYHQYTTLSTLARALELSDPKGNGVDGASVYELWCDETRHRDIARYCMGDVETTRAVYGRIVFEEEPAA